MFQDVFILGATGKVGKTLVSQIFDKRDGDPAIHRNPTRIVGVASSGSFLFRSKGIPIEAASSFSTRKMSGERYKTSDDLLELVQESYSKEGKKVIFVDATNSVSDMTHFHLKVIRNTKYGIVTANKNPLVETNFVSFNELTSETNRYGYRCSVMAGAEAVTKVRDLRDLNDKITLIEGCFSGTLGFIATELGKEYNLSDIVDNARNLGYTEPNPIDDLSGKDVEKKMLILARTAGYNVPLPIGIRRNPFIDHKYLQASRYPEFIKGLKGLDGEFKEKIREAKARGKVLRYVATFMPEGSDRGINIGLKEVPIDSLLGRLNGTSNKLIVQTQTYNSHPYSIEAPGAGLEITAQNIRRDLLYLIQRRVVRQ